MSLPSAVHVSSIIKRGTSGDWGICSSVVFRIGSFARYVYMCICILYSLFLLLFVFCFVQKKKEGMETRVIITKMAINQGGKLESYLMTMSLRVVEKSMQLIIMSSSLPMHV